MKTKIIRKSLLCIVAVSLLVGSAYPENLLNTSVWSEGTGDVGQFTSNGSAAENSREWGLTPEGTRGLLWKAQPNPAGNADGGWDSAYLDIDHSKMHRFSVWIKKDNSASGTTYFGLHATPGGVLNLDGSAISNAYFFVGDLPELDKWYLLVGYVHGSADASTVSYGGVYDGDSGAKVLSTQAFRFLPGSVQARHRAYLYYDTNVENRQYFYAPRVELVDGNEPTIAALLGISGGQWANLNGDTYRLNGNVGIGTDQPNDKLHVAGNATIDTVLSAGAFVTTSGAVSSFDSLEIDGDLYVGNKISLAGQEFARLSGDIFSIGDLVSGDGLVGHLSFRTNDETRMFLDSEGDVGIGTTDPKYDLDIGVHGSAPNLNLAAWTFLGEESSHNTTLLGNNARVEGNSTVVGSTTVDGYRAIRMKYSDGITFHAFKGSVTEGATVSHERMRITPEGNVGIGATQPVAPLEVVSEQDSEKRSEGITVQRSTGGHRGSMNVVGGGLNLVSEYPGTGYIPLTFGQYSTGINQYLERMRIDPNGNVGVGTSLPGGTRLRVSSASGEVFKVDDGGTAIIRANADGSVDFEKGSVTIGSGVFPNAVDDAKLSVVGKIRAEEIVVKLQSQWADYVFEDGYELPELADVQSYIDEHGHLPGIPSAETIESEGLSLASTQVLMMEKIEELTLYIIEQDRKISAQQKLIERLVEGNQ